MKNMPYKIVLPMVVGWFSILVRPEIALAQYAGDIAPPKINYVNRHWVNVATNKVQPMIEDVSIGGDLGLSHVTSTYTSDFANYFDGSAPYIMGPKDNFRGGLYSTLLDNNCDIKPVLNCESINTNWTYKLNVVGPNHSSSFTILDGGIYRPLGDQNDHLEYISSADFTGYVYTGSDGAELYFPSNRKLLQMEDIKDSVFRAALTKIIFPNGKEITIEFTSGVSPASGSISIDSRLLSITANTGFQLKYFYEEDERILPDELLNPENELVERIGIMAHWDSYQAKYIYGINAAIDFCSKTAKSLNDCTLSEDWPHATYLWPVGMPRAMYAGTSKFNIVSHAGNEFSFTLEPYERIGSIYPRITKIEKDGVLVSEYRHEFRQSDSSTSCMGSMCGIFSYAIGTPDLVESIRGRDSVGYFVARRNLYNDVGFGATGYPHNDYFQMDSSGLAWDANLLDRKVYYDHVRNIDKTQDSWRHPLQVNRIAREVYKIGTGEVVYQYDERGNVTEKDDNGLVWKAEYPSECNNRKTCNKPKWIEDPRGNRTDYTYHAQSGQLVSITGPADKHGVRPQTRYKYVQKYAHYKKNADQIEQADNPIWVLNTESYCRNSAYVESSCAGDDEVTISYEYSQENLFRIGKVISADSKSLRTCFGYDIYGNQLAEYPPAVTQGHSSCQDFQ